MKKKQYYPIYIASVILIIMVIALIILLVSGNKKQVYIPEKPENYDVSVGIASENFNSIRNIKGTTMKSKHFIVRYDKKDLELSVPNISLVQDKILVYNTLASEKPYLTSISLDGKEEFTTKISKGDYDSFEIKKAGKCNDNYCIVSIGKNKSKEDFIISYLNKKGKFIENKVVNVKAKSSIMDVLIENNTIVSISQEEDIVVETIKDNKIDKTYYLDDDENDMFINDNPILYTTYYDGKYLYMLCSNSASAYYLYKIDLANNKSTVKEIKGINNEVETKFQLKETGLYCMTDKEVLIYSLDGNYINKIDYQNVELENKKDYESYVDKEVEDITNNLTINKMLNNNSNIIESNTFYSGIYDVIDNGNITKRYMLNRIKNGYYGGLLSTFIINDTIYDIYSYGYDKPMLLVNIIK